MQGERAAVAGDTAQGSPGVAAVGAVLPDALGGIGGVAGDGDAGQGVGAAAAAHLIGVVADVGREQAAHACARRIGLVLCYSVQGGATGGLRRVIDRGNGHRDAVAGGAEGRAVDGRA
ncbi:hypothetical protein D3C78_1378460 [compost metagenome]